MTERRSRRHFLGTCLMAGVALPGLASSALVITPGQTEGPFYPTIKQNDKDADLTRIEGHSNQAKGEVVIVTGQVLDPDGTPLTNAVVDLWQANTHGRYSHQRDPNPAPLDPDFQGWAIVSTDQNGEYRCRTIRPGAYPVSDEWTRPPHIHFKVSQRGYHEITTQMYFEDEPLNTPDRLLKALTVDQQQAVIARAQSIEDAEATALFRFDVVLKPV